MLKVIRSQLHTLFIPLLFWLFGIILATKFNYHWSFNLIVTLCFGVMIFVPKLRFYFSLFILFSLGWMHTSFYLQPVSNEIGSYLAPDISIDEVFSYKILERKLTTKDKNYYIIELTNLNNSPLKGKVLLFNAPDSLKIFHHYQTPLQVRSIAKPQNPAEFDFARFYQYAGIEGSSSAIGITKLIGQDANFLERLKAGVISKIEETFGKDKAMALALFLGEKGLLKINQEELSEMGLLHLFAVSGLHVGIIYLTLLTILNLFFKMNYARFSSSVMLIFYAYLCGWSPSVVRTVLIIFIYNLTLLLQRKISFLQLISLTLFIITIFNPLELFSVGLHLSLTAFISLWIADRKIMPYFYKIKKKYQLNKYLFNLGQYLIYSLSVIIFIAPLSAYYFNIISLNAIITNLIATPIVTLMLNIILLAVVLPQGLMAQAYLSTAFSFLNSIFAEIINYARFLPFFSKGITLNDTEIISLILILSVAYFLYRKRKVLSLIFLASVSLALILSVSGLFVNYKNQVICFAAGKADCSYLEFADGENLLIDTGSQEQSPTIVKNSLLPYLRKRHIHKLDRLIITHPHEDHYGGLPLLAGNIKIGEIIIHQTALKDEVFTKLIADLADDENITVLREPIILSGGRIEIIHPDASYESQNMNNNSLVTKISYANYSLLFTGDIEEEAEQRLITKYGNKLKSDFLKVAHHGSSTSSTVEFIDNVNPDKCYIPAGNSDRDKFPNPLVLQRLRERNIEIYNGADDGALLMEFGD